MTNFENIKNMNIDEMADFLDNIGDVEDAPWFKWWNDNYCKKCDPVMGTIEYSGKTLPFSWCELHNNCKYFEDLDGIPDDPTTIIKMWLERGKE